MIILRKENTIYAISTHDLLDHFQWRSDIYSNLGVIKLSRIDINAGYANVRVFLSFVERNMSSMESTHSGNETYITFDNSRNFLVP